VGSQKFILIVEDDPDLRRLYRLTLVFDGFEVQEAVDGIDALRAIDERPPDLVLLDLDLPRLSGHSVYQEIAAHALTRHIPVVIVTATDIDPTTLDVACVLHKPVMPDELLVAVRKCLGAGAPTVGS
jgi:two-component system response regulator MprA